MMERLHVFVTALSPCQELYPICFGITSEAESSSTWYYILKHFKWACPIMRSPDDMVFSDSDEEQSGDKKESSDKGSDANGDADGDADSDLSSLCEPPMRDFVIVSDRDKGLKEALQSVLPHMHAMSCAVHIKSNVMKH